MLIGKAREDFGAYVRYSERASSTLTIYPQSPLYYLATQNAHSRIRAMHGLVENFHLLCFMVRSCFLNYARVCRVARSCSTVPIHLPKFVYAVGY